MQEAELGIGTKTNTNIQKVFDVSKTKGLTEQSCIKCHNVEGNESLPSSNLLCQYANGIPVVPNCCHVLAVYDSHSIKTEMFRQVHACVVA